VVGVDLGLFKPLSVIQCFATAFYNGRMVGKCFCISIFLWNNYRNCVTDKF
jgi:hypothetical protein